MLVQAAKAGAFHWHALARRSVETVATDDECSNSTSVTAVDRITMLLEPAVQASNESLSLSKP